MDWKEDTTIGETSQKERYRRSWPSFFLYWCTEPMTSYALPYMAGRAIWSSWHLSFFFSPFPGIWWIRPAPMTDTFKGKRNDQIGRGYRLCPSFFVLPEQRKTPHRQKGGNRVRGTKGGYWNRRIKLSLDFYAKYSHFKKECKPIKRKFLKIFYILFVNWYFATNCT